MQLHLDGKNVCVINKVVENFQDIYLIRERVFLKNKDGSMLSGGGINGERILACMHCEDVRTIILLMNDGGYYKITMVLSDKETFKQMLELFGKICSKDKMRAQYKKLNSYSITLINKFKNGETPTIMETKKLEDVIRCPECGMQCEPGIPYCMECGASIE